MKKAGLLLLGGIAALLFLANLGPLIGLAICLVILYFIYKGFMTAETSLSKVILAILGCIVIAASISNLPALIAVAAAIALYYVYKQWKQDEAAKEDIIEEEDDPFTNFEKQWAEFNRN